MVTFWAMSAIIDGTVLLHLTLILGLAMIPLKNICYCILNFISSIYNYPVNQGIVVR